MIRIGIIGYGNIGRGIELAVQQNPDMTLTDPNTPQCSTQWTATTHTKIPEYFETMDKAAVL